MALFRISLLFFFAFAAPAEIPVLEHLNEQTTDTRNVLMTFLLPRDAEMWAGDSRCPLTGPRRQVVTPDLDNNRRRYYLMTVRLPEYPGHAFRFYVNFIRGTQFTVDMNPLLPPGGLLPVAPRLVERSEN